MRYLLLAILLVSSVTACSTSTLPIYGNMVDESGNIVKTIAGETSDASVFKEQQVHETLRNRDIQYAKAYGKSGFKIIFEKSEIEGIIVYLPKEISFKEVPQFPDHLPTEPSRHPVWKTTESVIGTVAKYGLLGYGISELSGVLKSGYDNAGNHFNGDANLRNSFNGAGGNQSWTDSVNTETFGLPEGCSGLESYLNGNCN